MLFRRFALAIVGLRLRSAFRKKGKSRWEINELMDGFDQSVLEAAISRVDAMTNGAASDQIGMAPGDGSFWEWLDRFLDSEFGKLLMEILMALLMGLIGGMGQPMVMSNEKNEPATQHTPSGWAPRPKHLGAVILALLLLPASLFAADPPPVIGDPPPVVSTDGVVTYPKAPAPTPVPVPATTIQYQFTPYGECVGGNCSLPPAKTGWYPGKWLRR